MSPEDAQRDRQALQIVDRAIEMNTGETRRGYLERACRGDERLRARVEALLEHHVQDDFLERPAVLSPAEGTVTLPIAEKPGDRIGRYKLLQQIGEGGCGVVYMAEQDEPIQRRVALKVIKLGMDTQNVVARFEAERQALALMDHPSIAKVLDAGTTESGRPFFVMELVRGVKITDYCDQKNLSTRERLDLFIQVCHAIQHAHQKGIIHRDIKPSNILVTVNDGVPLPKVIDFGIAKATSQQRLTDKTLFTAFEQFIGTPAYMSPEQAEMTSLDIDTRSDIYALGVLLYELLTGATPFDAKTLLAAGLDEMRKTIREQEPLPPSTKLRQTQGASRGPSEIANPKSQIDLDLDWIVMKCLEKDRARRYETANGLAQDLERHLTHQPVVARPASTMYRMRKFARRNRVMVAAGAGVALALLLGVLVSGWQALRADRERARAEANERLAQRQAYAADVKVADTALREHNLGQAVTALRRQIPRPRQADLRGIEWRYLWQKCQGRHSAIFKHDAEVSFAELSPDGRWLASESGGRFWIWDMARERDCRALNSEPPLNAVHHAVGEHIAFDPQGRFLATAARSEVSIWKITGWLKERSLPATNASLAVSGNGTTLATFGEEGIQIWKTATWELLARPRTNYADFRHIALNRDGSVMAASCPYIHSNEATADEEVSVWRLPQCDKPWFTWPEIKAQELAISDDGRWLAAITLGPPAMVWLWSVPDGKPVARWLASPGLGRALAFAPGGQLLATAGSDQMIRLWDTGRTNLTPRLLQGHLSDVCSVRFAADGRLISASSDKSVRVWETNPPPSEPCEFQLPRARLICPPMPHAHRMLAINLTNLTFEEWDMDNSHCLRERRIQGADALLDHGRLANGQPLQTGVARDWFVFDTDVSPGTARVNLLGMWANAASPAWDLCANTADGRFFAWTAETGELVYSNKVAATMLGAIPVADHQKLLLFEWATYPDAALSAYDLQTHRTDRIEEHVMTSPLVLELSPDTRRFAYFTPNGLVKVWDATTQQTQPIVKPPKGNVLANPVTLAFSPDSRWLAVATEAGWAQVFDVTSGQPVCEPPKGFFSGTIKIDFSADARSLVTYGEDGTARLWDLATGREMLSGLPLNQLLTYHLGWKLLPPDGNSVLEGAGEGLIRVVRLRSLAEIDAADQRDKETRLAF